MATTYTIHSRPAIAGGILAAAGATALLVRDGFETGFTLDHALMPVLVAITILSAHLAWQALREWSLTAIGLAFLAVFGSALTIYETMGRRAEIRDTKTMTAAASEAKRTRLETKLSDTQRTLKYADEGRALECAGAPNPIPNSWPECRRKTGHVDALKAQIGMMKADLATLKPVPVDAKAERVAAIASFFGASNGMVKSAVGTFEPFLLPLFLELGSIVLFAFGVGHTTTKRETSVKVPSKPEPVRPATAITERDFSIDPITDEEIDEIKRVLGMRGLMNKELAAKLGVSEGQCSKIVSAAVAAGKLSKETDPSNRRAVLIKAYA